MSCDCSAIWRTKSVKAIKRRAGRVDTRAGRCKLVSAHGEELDRALHEYENRVVTAALHYATLLSFRCGSDVMSLVCKMPRVQPHQCAFAGITGPLQLLFILSLPSTCSGIIVDDDRYALQLRTGVWTPPVR